MGIQVPAVNQGLSPYGGYNPSLATPGVLGSVNSPTSAPTLTSPLLGGSGGGPGQRGAAIDYGALGGSGAQNPYVNYGQQTQELSFNPMSPETGAARIGQDVYGSIKYERINGQAQYLPVYNYSGGPVLFRNGQAMRDENGNYAAPSAIRGVDINREALSAGMSATEYTQYLDSNGYTFFGGAWVFVGGTGTSTTPGSQNVRPPRLANGNLVRRRGPDDLTWQERRSGKLNPEHQKRYDEWKGGSGGATVGTSSSNFGVGTG